MKRGNSLVGCVVPGRPEVSFPPSVCGSDSRVTRQSHKEASSPPIPRQVILSCPTNRLRSTNFIGGSLVVDWLFLLQNFGPLSHSLSRPLSHPCLAPCLASCLAHCLAPCLAPCETSHLVKLSLPDIFNFT